MDVKLTVRGPILEGRGPGHVKKMLEGAVDEMVDLGMVRLNEVLRPRPAGVYLSVQEARKGKASTGHYRRSVHGERKDTMGRIDDSGVRYGFWLEGTSSRNQTTRFKGYHSFALTAKWLEGEAPKVLQAHAKKLVGELS